MIPWVLLPVALAADSALETAVSQVTTTYATCQASSKDVHDPKAVRDCEEALLAVRDLAKLLKAHPEWSASKSLLPKLEIYERNLSRALVMLRRSSAQVVATPITNEGAQVVAITSQEVWVFFQIHFEEDSTDIRPRDLPIIQEACAISMSQDPPILLEVTGHSDSRGRAHETQERSRIWAEAVADALVDCGVSRNNIRVVAVGEMSPVYPNRTAYGRAQNRRVEITRQSLVPDVP